MKTPVLAVAIGFAGADASQLVTTQGMQAEENGSKRLAGKIASKPN